MKKAVHEGKEQQVDKVGNDPYENQQIYDDPWDPDWHWTEERGWYWEKVSKRKAPKRKSDKSEVGSDNADRPKGKRPKP